jgi:hypothetical protein
MRSSLQFPKSNARIAHSPFRPFFLFGSSRGTNQPRSLAKKACRENARDACVRFFGQGNRERLLKRSTEQTECLVFFFRDRTRS